MVDLLYRNASWSHHSTDKYDPHSLAIRPQSEIDPWSIADLAARQWRGSPLRRGFSLSALKNKGRKEEGRLEYRALLALPLDSVNDLVGWRDLGGKQLAVLLLEGHHHFGAGLQAFHRHAFSDREGCAVL